MSDDGLARLAIACLDLTDLSETGTDGGVDELCRRAQGPYGQAAAVCIWPQFVSRAREALGDAPVRIATVVNFPAGRTDVERAVDDAAEALSDGADELDVVLPYRAYLAGDEATARDLVAAVRDVAGQDRVLKVILETGALGSAAVIEGASRLAIEAGADFLKTSTGKSPISATPEAAEVMLGAIKAAGRPVGLKVSGGIRTFEDARGYMALAERVMGPGFVAPATFRIGASGLLDALNAAVEGRSASASGAY